MRRITPWRAVALAAATSSLAIAAAAGAAAATAATARSGPARAAIAGTRPTWAIAKNEVRGGAAGAVAGSGTVTANVYLASRDPSGLTAFSTAVSTPGNALYGHYLTARQTTARFGPSKAEVAAVEGWLTGSGLAVTKVSDEIGGYVEVRGSLAAAARAFDVTFGAYREDGVTVRAPQQTATAGRPRGRRARRQRPGHRQPPSEALRRAAPARAELLDGRAVLDLLRAEDRVRRSDCIRGPSSRTPTAGTRPGRSAAPTASPSPG